MMRIDFKNLQINELQPQTDFEKKVFSFIEEFVSDSVTVSVQSSGSTGIPKKFSVDKEKMINSAAMTCSFLNLNEGDTALLCLPVEYISGKMMIVRSLFQKWKLCVQNPGSKPLESIDFHVDFCAMTPLQVENSLAKIHLIKNLIIGGAAVSESLKLKINENLKKNSANTKVFETYGMSETLSHIALKSIYPVNEDFFKAFNSVEISVNENGCLAISAPGLIENILQTNDLVEIKNGNEFRFLGRADNVINSGGAKIFPEELEALVKTKISNETVFLGLKNEYFGERLVAVVEGLQSDDIELIISSLDYPKKFQRPKEIFFVSEIPRTANGKVNRTELRIFLENEKSSGKKF